jgi:hypothetical protein
VALIDNLPDDLPVAFDPLTFGADIIGAFLATLFGDIFSSGPSTQQLQTEINTLTSELGQAVDTLKRFAWTIAYGLGSALNSLWQAIEDFISKLWSFLKKLAEDFVTLVKEALPAIMNAIRTIRSFLQMIYQNYIMPILAWLQLARKYLAILRLFHVAWAAKLDGYLENLQARIIGPFLYVLGAINGVANWVNVILTAGAILQRPVFINTMYAYQQDWVNMWWQGQQTAPGPTTTPAAPPVAPTAAQVNSDLLTYFQTGGGDYAADMTTAQQACLAAMQSA